MHYPLAEYRLAHCTGKVVSPGNGMYYFINARSGKAYGPVTGDEIEAVMRTFCNIYIVNAENNPLLIPSIYIPCTPHYDNAPQSEDILEIRAD